MDAALRAGDSGIRPDCSRAQIPRAVIEGEPGACRQGLLGEARSRDAITLLNLISRSSEQERGAMFARPAQLVSLPPSVTREDVLRRDERKLDRVWHRVGYGNVKRWRIRW